MLAQAVEVKLQRLEPLAAHANPGSILELELDVHGPVDTLESDLAVIEPDRRQPPLPRLADIDRRLLLANPAGLERLAKCPPIRRAGLASVAKLLRACRSGQAARKHSSGERAPKTVHDRSSLFVFSGQQPAWFAAKRTCPVGEAPWRAYPAGSVRQRALPCRRGPAAMGHGVDQARPQE
jgi:hypothetical protein